MRRILDDGSDRNGLSGFLLLPMMNIRVERATAVLFIQFHVFHEPPVGSIHARLKHIGFLVPSWWNCAVDTQSLRGCGRGKASAQQPYIGARSKT